jgi:hypothetical protein
MTAAGAPLYPHGAFRRPSSATTQASGFRLEEAAEISDRRYDWAANPPVDLCARRPLGVGLHWRSVAKANEEEEILSAAEGQVGHRRERGGDGLARRVVVSDVAHRRGVISLHHRMVRQVSETYCRRGDYTQRERDRGPMCESARASQRSPHQLGRRDGDDDLTKRVVVPTGFPRTDLPDYPNL